jgi:twitching motility two-component system response regulator PilH
MSISQKILVVEDSPTTRRQITEILESQGYEVISAEDGEAALELVREHHPELVVLDIVLPKKNGYQVCRNIKADPDLAIKVMMLTAKDQEKDRIWGQRQGADGYLSKPVNADELVESVAKMMSPNSPSLNTSN